jgi:ferric-dicitrate binding protein FerR (iron transport regulator)
MYKRLAFRIAGAAAIILLLGAGAYLWIQHQDRPDITRNENRPGLLKNDALPGRNGAILTLADKHQVVLDSLGDGVVTTQGKTTVLIKNGQLVYAAAGPEGALLYNTMTTPRGRQYQLTLPDGSIVWLNAASSITYPTAFSAAERSVSITGEAYFEVTKDRTRPFRVKVNEMQVEVLGTSFNINAYPDQASIRTTLLKGSVKVRSVQAAVTLQPGQQASLSASSSAPLLQVRSDADIDEVMAWKNGFFKFNDTDIRTVMQQLERWYDLQVVYEGAVPKDHFGGKLPRDANASEVLKALEQTQVHFRIEGKKLIVMP